MGTNRGPFLCLLALACVCAWSAGARGAGVTQGVWVTQQVDTYHDVGLLTSLAVDPSSSFPAISYYDQTNYCLKYASWEDSVWTNQTVDSGFVGTHSSLAFYSTNTPRISYTSYDPVLKVVNGVKYASWNGSSWTTQFVQSGSNLGEYTSLAIDSMGQAHISYYDRGNGTLKYATQSGSQWNIQTVDTGDVGLYSSLKLDVNGNPRIAYHDETNGTLKYAAWDGSAWQRTVVDSSAHVGAHPSLALTSMGDPIISYFDSTNTDLKLAMYLNGTWHTGVVDATPVTGFGNSLALDPVSDLPRIAYATGDPATDTDLKLAWWDGEAWQFETVDSPGIVGEFPSLALGRHIGEPMISYYDRTNGDLKFASPDGMMAPEPATLGVLAIGMLAAWSRRPRARHV